MVHYEVGNPTNKIALGRWIKAGNEHTALEAIFDDLDPLETIGYVLEDFDLRTLLPAADKRQTYRYTGGLTTPDFKTVVNWIVFHDPMEMSLEQINEFKGFLNNTSNARALQDLNGRVVKTDAPAPSAVALLSVAGIMATRRRR